VTLRLHLDEDGMDGDLVRALRAQGADVTTALEAGMLGRDDDEHLAFAAAGGRVLLSHNVRDFYRLHTEWLAAGPRTPASSWRGSSATRSASWRAGCSG
jgi:hypothetical protein